MGGQFSPTQIEITLVTSQDPQQVRKMAEACSAELDLVHLRKITTVCVRDLDQVLRHRLGRMGRHKHREEEEEEEQEEEEAGNEMTLSAKSDSPSELDQCSMQMHTACSPCNEINGLNFGRRYFTYMYIR